MSMPPIALTRRSLLLGAGGAAVAAALPIYSETAGATAEYRIVAGAGRAPLVGGGYPATAVWAYNGTIPGPEIRARQGERLRVTVENRLREETTIHWHGVRVPNAMDGVPHLTQKPIVPGETFVYEFDLPDAGTFWYHPHQRGFEQVARGLYGALIVEEPEPVVVDRDLTWVLGDWRLQPDAQISDDFGNMMDTAMAGRVGNTVTINGRLPDTVAVRSGERIRLRLINTANARIFGLEFTGHRPQIVAYDGQPVEPHAPPGGRVVIGPAMRVDLVLDMAARPGARFTVVDSFYRGLEYRLVDLVYGEDAPLPRRSESPLRLPANPLPEPNLESAVRHEIAFGGGMMGGMGGMMGGMRDGGGMMGGGGSGSGTRGGPSEGLIDGGETMRGFLDQMTRGGMGGGGMMGGGMGGGMMDQMMRGGGMGGMMDRGGGMRQGGVWTVNGVSASGHVMKPLLTLQRDQSYVLALRNETAWHHPIHLHGHSFRVIARNGRPTAHREWQDTVLIAPRDSADIAFVADNPGDWMIHCHILEHQEGGMMGVLRVA